uniref:cytochrome c oxidase subunit 3 n=1 Tax=Meteora sporadica TaxID=2913902 RepID=UPI0030033DB5|nr:cytochrome c oxidase subunit 3 [Meteora sporadica]WVH37100.1 cytochrome c oxidase subunit 3 [Meteora sporadica]
MLNRTFFGKFLEWEIRSVSSHPYHMVDVSPWPILAAFSGMTVFAGGIAYMHSFSNGGFLLSIGLLSVLACMFVWFRDIIREGVYEGHHTPTVENSLRYGMILFILSEVLFFFAFFWGFYHSSLAPTVEIGAVWPPFGLHTLDAWSVPLVNTCLLLLSGFTLTWSHHALICGDTKVSSRALLLTIVLAAVFTLLQLFEYMEEASFTIADGIYGSTFYVSTGFHGLHVIIGTIMLSVCLLRMKNNQFTQTHHFGFEAAAWYWHFVDVVWLCLFVSVYWWGG